jgi:RHS repeat-associated protein
VVSSIDIISQKEDTYSYEYDALGQLLTEKHMAVGEEAFTDVGAWGKCTVIANEGVGIGDINPFRYRGYYYDKEIGMYYLQSRYYDPEVGRFVNGDEVVI